MRRVILESPYAAGAVEQWAVAATIADNVAYAKRCMLDCLGRGDAPIASHLLWTQDGLLDDLDPDQRKAGIEAGLAWGPVADAAVFYVDRGASRGMIAAAERYASLGVSMEWRTLERGPVFAPRAMLAIRDLQAAARGNLQEGAAGDFNRALDNFYASLRNSGAGRLLEKLAEALGRRG